MLAGVDRICPFLALAADLRTVTDGYDADHRCRAVVPPTTLERDRQLRLCLTERYVECSRYAARGEALAASASSAPPPAHDTLVARTRLVIEPEPAWRRIRRSGRRPLAIVLAVALLVVVAGAAAAASGAARPLIALFSTPATAAPPAGGVLGSMSSAPVTGASPTQSPTPTPSATPSPTLQPLPSIAPPAATPSPARRYVVQSGDTLSLIAQRFGTTVAALQQANGLASPDVIAIGQVLIIP